MCMYIAFFASVPFAMVFTNPRHSLYTMRHFTYLGGVSKNSLAVTVPYSLTLLSCSLVCFANHSSVKALFLICPFCLLTLSALPCCGLCTVCMCNHLPSSLHFLFLLLPLFSTISFCNCIILFQHTIQSI